MAILKNIAKLSDKDAKSREAQFEAEMLALASQGEPPRPAAAPRPSAVTSPTPPDMIWPPLEAATTPTPPATISSAAPAPAVNAIQILVTDNGQTTCFNNLQSVPAPVRQQVISAWLTSPTTTVPPVFNAPALRSNTLSTPAPSPTTKRPKTMKVAMFLNLMIPGAGQFYLGQRVAGATYALAFLASFAALIIIFVHGYFNYLNLSTSGDILDTGNLEQVARAFPAGIISALSAVGMVIYLASTIHLAVSRTRSVKQPDGF